MKRILTAVALGAAIVMPNAASSQAASNALEGTTAARGVPQFRILFTIVSRDGRPVRLTDFRYRGLRALCDGGTTIYAKGEIGSIRVKPSKRFSKTVSRNGKTVRVAGDVRRRGRKVVGTIRASGNYGMQTNCDSGKVEWVATRK